MNFKLLNSIIFIGILFSSCDKSTLDTNISGEIFKKYIGNYNANGTQTRYRVGFDTTTRVDTFKSTITKIVFVISNPDSALTDSKVVIQNFLGTGKDIDANATYANLYAFSQSQLPNLKNIRLVSESATVINYSYYKVNGPADTSRFSGKMTKL